MAGPSVSEGGVICEVQPSPRLDKLTSRGELLGNSNRPRLIRNESEPSVKAP